MKRGSNLNDLVDRIHECDCIENLSVIPSESIHLILSDIPYGIAADDWDVIHDNTNSALLGTSPAQRKAGAVFSKRGKPINGWSAADRLIPKQYYDWCSSWASEWFRVLKPGASAFVFAGRRFSHRCITALEDAGFSLKDSLAWLRGRAPHRAQRLSVVFDRRDDTENAKAWEGWRVGNLRPIFEPIIWVTKPYKIGTTIADNVLAHQVGAYDQSSFERLTGRPDNVLEIGFDPSEAGHHPTQKPVRLMKALIALTTQPGQIVLDPFAGSGTTAVAAHLLDRQFIAFERDPKYAEIARSRLQECEMPLLASCK